MKCPDRTKISKLEELPNVGRAIADKLRLIGINHPGDLSGKDPYQLYEQLCMTTEERCDPCLLDTFIAAVHFMEGGKPLPWWFFTAERKRHQGH